MNGADDAVLSGVIGPCLACFSPLLWLRKERVLPKLRIEHTLTVCKPARDLVCYV